MITREESLKAESERTREWIVRLQLKTSKLSKDLDTVKTSETLNTSEFGLVSNELESLCLKEAERQLWLAQHRGMQFGATSAVYAWRRIGNLIAWLLMVQARFPVGRCVDDFFGASRAGVTWAGGEMLDILRTCLVFLPVPKKARDFRGQWMSWVWKLIWFENRSS